MKSSKMIWVVFPVLLSMELSYVIPCNVSDVDIHKYQRQFEDLISNGVGMIYVNVSSPSFDNLTLAQKDWNKVIDWIWVTDKYKHFLSYPIDIGVFTLGLIMRNVRSIKLNVDIEHIENCTSDILSTRVYEYLFKVHNRSDGYYCHQYFENQDWKIILYNISHVSIGYGFHCFQKNDSSSPFTIKKSPMIYIIISIILILFFYYPMMLSPFAREKNDSRRLLVYTKADYPYSPRRLFLYIFLKDGDIIRPNNITTQSDKSKLRLPRFRNVFGVVRFTVLITIVTGIASVIKIYFIMNCSDCMPPNASIYDSVYVFDRILYRDVLLITFVAILGFSIQLMLTIYILAFVSQEEDELVLICTDVEFIRSIPVSCFLKKKRHMKESKTLLTQTINRIYLIFSLKFWSKIYLLPLKVGKKSCFFVFFKLVCSPIIFVCNVLLITLFLGFPIFRHLYAAPRAYFYVLKVFTMFRFKCPDNSECPQISNPFSRSLYRLLSIVLSFGFAYALVAGTFTYHGMSCVVQFSIYIIFVAIPHSYSTHLHIFFISTAIVSYMSKFFLEFLKLYRLLLQKIMEIKGTNEIEIKDFDTIVRQCCPVRQEVFFLFAKVIMTSFLLIIMYMTLNELDFLDRDNNFDLNTFLMYAFVLLTPGFLEVMFFESNADKVERMHDEINQLFRDLNEHSIYDSADENSRTSADYKNEGRCMSWGKSICLCCCGCLGHPHDENDHCKCCYTLEEVEYENGERVYVSTYFNCKNFVRPSNQTETFEMEVYSI